MRNKYNDGRGCEIGQTNFNGIGVVLSGFDCDGAGRGAGSGIIYGRGQGCGFAPGHCANHGNSRPEIEGIATGHGTLSGSGVPTGWGIG